MLTKNRLITIAAGLLMCGACSDTGIIVEVTRSEDRAQLANIDSLEFFIGTDISPGFDILLPDPGEREVTLPEGRDLLERPFRLLLEVGDFGEEDAFDTDVHVVVIGSTAGQRVGFGAIASPVRFQDGKVLEYTVTLDRNGRSFGDIDEGCVSIAVGDNYYQFGSPDDFDCDGDPNDEDCSPLDPTVGHNQPENCFNAQDDDCDGLVDADDEENRDGDAFTNCEMDCDDTDNTVFPGAEELCDGKDNDCQGGCDDVFADADGDGYLAECASFRFPDGTCRADAPEGPDCNDGDKSVHPEKTEICDGKDNDCNAFCDDELSDSEDPDGDHFGQCAESGLWVHSRPVVPGGSCVADEDCDPLDPFTHPGAQEICDGVDNDCAPGNEVVDDVPCFTEVGETCVIGSATCDDSPLDGLGAGTCTPPMAEPTEVPSTLCVAGDDCLDEADPFLCQLEQSVGKEVSCDVFYTVTAMGLRACGESLAFAPSHSQGLNDLDCSWMLLHGYGFFDVALLAEGGPVPPLEAAAKCDVSLGVTGDGDAPSFGKAFVTGTVEGTETIFQLNLAPVAVFECPQFGLACDEPWQRPATP